MVTASITLENGKSTKTRLKSLLLGVAMAANYTQDQVEYMVNQYRLKPDRETVDMLADELDKSIKIYHRKAK